MKKKVIRASGGVVERKDDKGLRIALVRRKRRGRRFDRKRDWVLPKGKPDGGEKIRQAALREVKEETGYAVKFKKGRKLKAKYATRRGNQKVVIFFRMRSKKKLGLPDASEITKVKWFAPAVAIERLSYGTERKIVRAMYPKAAKGSGRGRN